MKRTILSTILIIAAVVSVLGSRTISAQDKYTVQVPGGLAFSEFRGYESWQAVAISHAGRLALILANPVMIDAYQAGIPGNGKPFPDGAMMAKIHWNPKASETAPAPTTVPGALHDVDFMVKDSKRFADGGGWGYAEFEYDTASETFRPGNLSDQPPQANDAKCCTRSRRFGHTMRCPNIARARHPTSAPRR
jgi:hypothetical protein